MLFFGTKSTYSVQIIETYQSDYSFVTWVKKPSPASSGLVVSIMVCQGRKNQKLRGLILS